MIFQHIKRMLNNLHIPDLFHIFFFKNDKLNLVLLPAYPTYGMTVAHNSTFVDTLCDQNRYLI